MSPWRMWHAASPGTLPSRSAGDHGGHPPPLRLRFWMPGYALQGSCGPVAPTSGGAWRNSRP
eukprot:14530251-Alexandrium_andersonii.AAC.1